MTWLYLFGGALAFHGFRAGYSFMLRKATGWEDGDSKEYFQKQVQKFQDNNKDAEVIKLKEDENYF